LFSAVNLGQVRVGIAAIDTELLDLLDSESEGEDGDSDHDSASDTRFEEDAELDEEVEADDSLEEGSDDNFDEGNAMDDDDADLDEEGGIDDDDDDDDEAMEEEEEEEEEYGSASEEAVRMKYAETRGMDAAATEQAAAPEPVGKYVPPSARKAMGEPNENRVRLERLLRGLLNRYSRWEPTAMVRVLIDS